MHLRARKGGVDGWAFQGTSQDHALPTFRAGWQLPGAEKVGSHFKGLTKVWGYRKAYDADTILETFPDVKRRQTVAEQGWRGDSCMFAHGENELREKRVYLPPEVDCAMIMNASSALTEKLLEYLLPPRCLGRSFFASHSCAGTSWAQAFAGHSPADQPGQEDLLVAVASSHDSQFLHVARLRSTRT